MFTTQIAADNFDFSFGYFEGSPNDPYVDFEIISERIVIAINRNHPLVAELISDPHSQTVLEVFLAIDALTQYEIGLRESEQGNFDLIAMRDTLLRIVGHHLT